MKHTHWMIVATLSALCCGGCYEQLSGSGSSAYAAALEKDAVRRAAAWDATEQRQAEKTAREDEAWQQWEQRMEEEAARKEKAWAESDAVRQKQKELTTRWEAVLIKQEQQAARFDAILDQWESMSLPGKGSETPPSRIPAGG